MHQSICGCTSCQTRYTSGRCAIKDCMQDVYVKEAQSDILVLLSPLVHGSLNEPTKKVCSLLKCLDRLLVVLHPSIIIKNGLTCHPLRSYKKKALLPIVFAPPGVIEEEKKVFECALKFHGNHFPLGCVPVFISTTWSSAQIEREIVQARDTRKRRAADAPVVTLSRELADTYVPSPSEHSQRVLIIPASRNMKGFTLEVSRQVEQFLHKNCSDVHVELATGHNPAAVAAATKSVDTIILIFPIYTFSSPALVLAIMDEIWSNGPRPDLKVFAVSHFALYDAEVGLAAIGYASGPLVPGHSVTPPVLNGIAPAVSAIIGGKPVTGSRWELPIPKMVYLYGANLHMAVWYG
ncbi:hypothetical protein Pelo_1777 [Pelomyxa schiedti]|nr:hypothetical protein Pelo_1777 [Pelomyxa schiedti]